MKPPGIPTTARRDRPADPDGARVVDRIDVRTVPPPRRHPLIFGTFDTLALHEALEIVNDHDPLPLFFQFERVRGGQFDWDYLEAGPLQWQVRITRTAPGLPGLEIGAGCGGGCRAHAG
jgi:uncharacterized protein (DUF2249 family)